MLHDLKKIEHQVFMPFIKAELTIFLEEYFVRVFVQNPTLCKDALPLITPFSFFFEVKDTR